MRFSYSQTKSTGARGKCKRKIMHFSSRRLQNYSKEDEKWSFYLVKCHPITYLPSVHAHRPPSSDHLARWECIWNKLIAWRVFPVEICNLSFIGHCRGVRHVVNGEPKKSEKCRKLQTSTKSEAFNYWSENVLKFETIKCEYPISIKWTV